MSYKMRVTEIMTPMWYNLITKNNYNEYIAIWKASDHN